ncbi:hypothetical protein SLEP1_g36664 [Rubroshorea leprosula]|uniref:Late embryogenesis abundant protein LEA-2 subgroup domain-containing protein n=1 Tax=Rubroshorea leprosula TaxID=152421 RepID=A0AAV5KSH6_9ROSI|nr:hypothetical protein SLEP1_g36664 [Rubroshorea leprosula]
MDVVDQDTGLIFHPYYVQSPSTLSHANSNTAPHPQYSISPTPSESNFVNDKNHNPQLSRLTLSRYSSSRGSDNSFVVNDSKKICGAANRLVILDGSVNFADDSDDEEEDDGEWFYGRKRTAGWWWRYCSFRTSNSCAWISLQISWRLLLSLGVALLVFYTATKPPPPKVSIQVGGVGEFVLGEGVDGSGVTTKILTCNCSINLVIENKSKLFGLHIHPPIMEMAFGRLPFAFSNGPKLYVETYGSSLFKLYVGTKNKPMYGAGRNMEDMLESGMGLPVVIRVRLSSSFRLVWKLINPKFHHKAQCLLLLYSVYDDKHKTQKYKSTCTVAS